MSNRKKIKTANYVRPTDDNVHFEKNGVSGFAISEGHGVVTFEVQGVQDREDILFAESKSIYSRYMNDRQSMRLGGYTVPWWGEGNNLYPQEVNAVVTDNKLLPGILEKLGKFMFGKGPALYQKVIVGEGADQKEIRVPYHHAEIEDWLYSWEQKGYEHYWDYLKTVTYDYYYVKTRSSKFHFNKSRRLSSSKRDLPIDALSYVGPDEARLATDKDMFNRIIRNQDCKHVIIGDWLNINASKYEVYHRFSMQDPFRHPIAVSFDFEKTFTKWVYAFNGWFKALREYLKASHLSPKYLNSYLRNALNAHIHAIIPGNWVDQMKTILQEICTNNAMSGDSLPATKEFKGVKLYNDKGQPYAFNEAMVDELIACELRRITSMMSGEGKNQGKMYATVSWDDHPWKFEKFPGEFKDYFETVLKYAEHADAALLANMGVSSSLISVDNNGRISNKGAEAWYSYLLHIITTTTDEFFITRDINRAIQLNFPEVIKDKVFIGFPIDIPSKLRDTTEGERPQNTATDEL